MTDAPTPAPARGLTHLGLAARRITTDGLYTPLLERIEADSGDPEPSQEKIVELLRGNDTYLEDYRRLNREHGISNIDVAEISLPADADARRRRLADDLNRQLARLRPLERFAAPASIPVYGLWVGSAVVLVVFAAHNVFALFTSGYRDYPLLVYGSYLLLTVAGAVLTVRLAGGHNRRHAHYRQLHAAVATLLEQALAGGLLDSAEIFGDKPVAEEGDAGSGQRGTAP